MKMGACGQIASNAVASRTPAHAFTGTGSRQRRSPTGGCAYGMPLNAAPPLFSRAPLICPPVTVAIGPESAQALPPTSTSRIVARTVGIGWSPSQRPQKRDQSLFRLTSENLRALRPRVIRARSTLYLKYGIACHVTPRSGDPAAGGEHCAPQG